MCELGVCKTRKVTPAEIVIVDGKLSFLNAKYIADTSDYSIFIQEDELIDVMGYYYFFMEWLPSTYVNNFSDFKKIILSTTWLACEAIENNISKGNILNGNLKSFYKNNIINISGSINKLLRIPGIQQGFILENGTYKYSVGEKMENLKILEWKKLNWRINKLDQYDLRSF